MRVAPFRNLSACLILAVAQAATIALGADVPLEIPRVLDDRLQIELFAADPDIVTPCGLAVDARGRVLVVESHTHFRPKDYQGPPADRIRMLEDTDGDGDTDVIYSYGGRSFSIWNAAGELVFDSGDQIEQIVADTTPYYFNASNTNNKIDNRSDNKGPEPEGLAIGEVNGSTYAFVGLERQGGIMVFNITNPFAPQFVSYELNRDFSVDIGEIEDGNLTAAAAGDLAPEGLAFVSADNSPSGNALLIVGNEVSGTTTVYEFK